jgi:hypothetical protein
LDAEQDGHPSCSRKAIPWISRFWRSSGDSARSLTFTAGLTASAAVVQQNGLEQRSRRDSTDTSGDHDELRRREVLEAIPQKLVDENAETQISRIDGLLELSDHTPGSGG